MLADKKYHHFRPVLDAYIETRYNATKAYAYVPNSLKGAMSRYFSIFFEIQSIYLALNWISKIMI